MNIYYTLLISILFYGCSTHKPSQESNYTIIEETTIIDVLHGNLIPNKTIIIKDSVILKICDEYSKADFKSAKLIDGRGKYLIPGLWDMHFHLCWEKNNDSLLFNPLLSYGITGIRDMGGDLTIQNHFKKLINANPSTGPEIYGAGPIFDGNPPVFYDFTLPLDVDSNIDSLLGSTVSNGSNFIKTYSLIREPELTRISNYSSLNNIPFAGHLSEYIEPEKSIELGQKSIEHLNRLDEIWETNPERIDSILYLMQKFNSWLCPTLVIYDKKVHISNPDIELEKYNAFIHPTLMQEWISSRERRINRNKEIDSVDIQNKFDSLLGLLGHLHRNGVKILAGSDFGGMPFVYPGIGLHQELTLLCKAGLSNAEALAAATINPAIYFSIEDRYGSVSEDKIADLVLLDKNPLENIENTQTIVLVIRKGIKVEKLLPTMYKRH